MWKLRMCLVAAIGMFALGTGSAALASSGGDSNAGDVWTDNVGQPAGPGHEQDPHLTCTNINLWGAGLADGGGSYTIDGWPPSGSQEVDYTSTWSYNTAEGGDQVVDVINVQQLISEANANGDTPSSQGYHFKLDFSQDPQKHKTFWVNCPAPSGTPTTSTQSASSSGTSSGTGTSSPTTATSPTTSATTQANTTVSKPAKKRKHSLKAAHSKHKRRALVKPKRHRKPRTRSVKAVTVSSPAFTG
jgi:hypothetical protein